MEVHSDEAWRTAGRRHETLLAAGTSCVILIVVIHSALNVIVTYLGDKKICTNTHRLYRLNCNEDESTTPNKKA